MCLNNAILFDEAANDEADRHSQMMREQRKPRQTVTSVTADANRTTMGYYPSVWKGIKTGADYEK